MRFLHSIGIIKICLLSYLEGLDPLIMDLIFSFGATLCSGETAHARARLTDVRSHLIWNQTGIEFWMLVHCVY